MGQVGRRDLLLLLLLLLLLILLLLLLLLLPRGQVDEGGRKISYYFSPMNFPHNYWAQSGEAGGSRGAGAG